MQEKVSASVPETPATTTQVTPKYSVVAQELLLSGVMEFLQSQSQIAQLQNITNTIKTIEQQMLDRPQKEAAPTLKAAPKAPTMQSMQQRTATVADNQTNAQKVASLLQQLQQAKTTDEIVSILTQIIILLEGTEPPLSLSADDQNTLLNAFLALPSPEDGKDFSDLSEAFVIILLCNLVKNGASKEQVMAKLNELANAQPPNLFTAGAKRLLSEINFKGGDDFLYTKVLQDPSAEEDNWKFVALWLTPQKLPADFSSSLNAFIKTASEENTAPLMKDVVATDTGNSATSTLVQTEITYLAKMLSILLKYAPNNPQVKKYAQLLAQIEKDYPNLTADEIAQLNDMAQNIGDLETSLANQGILPKDEQVAFLQQLYFMFKKLVDETNNLITQYQTLLAQVKQALDQIAPIATDFKTVKQLLDILLSGKPLTTDQAQKLVEALADLMQMYGTLAPEDQARVDELFSQLGKIGTTLPFSQLMGDMLLKYLMDQNPGASTSTLLQLIQQRYGTAAGSNTTMNSIVSYMQSAVQDGKFPNNLPFANASFTFSSSNFWTMMTETFSAVVSGDKTGLPAADAEATEDDSYYGDLESQLTAQATGIQSTLDQLQALDPQFEKSEANAHNKYYAHASLANQFYDAILNHFMPGQDAFLMQIAAILFFYNFAGDTYNTLLGDMSGFDSAQGNYTFGNFQPSQTTGYSTVNNALTKEKEQVDNDLAKTQQAEDDIKKGQQELDQKKADLQKQYDEGKISKKDYDNTMADYNKLGDQLDRDYASLEKIKSNLLALHNPACDTDPNATPKGELDLVHITPEGPDGYWMDKGDPKAISQAENNVVNGDPTYVDPKTGEKFPGFGGLSTTFGDVSKVQQGYSTLSTEQQTKLSETMTEVQQEWSIVSSAMQILNEVYLTFAQNIYK